MVTSKHTKSRDSFWIFLKWFVGVIGTGVLVYAFNLGSNSEIKRKRIEEIEERSALTNSILQREIHLRKLYYEYVFINKDDTIKAYKDSAMDYRSSFDTLVYYRK